MTEASINFEVMNIVITLLVIISLLVIETKFYPLRYMNYNDSASFSVTRMTSSTVVIPFNILSNAFF